MTVRVLIVDDQELVRRGIRSLLASRDDWSVCGEACDGVQATELARELRPDIVLMDMSMPRMDGIEATRIIRKEVPESQVIIVSQNDPATVRIQATEVNASGYVAKGDLPRELVPTIERVFEGRRAQGGAQGEMQGSEGPESMWLEDRTQMGALLHKTDWSKTLLGPPSTWSAALRMMVKFLLANRFPQLLWWGPEFCSLYNDAYIPILGEKHPWAIGRPVKEVWHEIWHILKPLIETPYQGGPATWMEDIPLEINRRGFFEETHFTVAYSPVPDESAPNGIGGVLATVNEITDQVIGERRVIVLRDLGARAVHPKSVEEACTLAAETLSRHPKDVPFVLIYLLEANEEARLVCGAGVEINDRGCPKAIRVAGSAEEGWPLSRVLETGSIELVQDLGSRFQTVPRGSWSDPPREAAVVPVRSNVPRKLSGLLIVGLSSRLRFDEKYRDFLELMSTQIATSIANARAYEEERKRAEALAEIDRAKTLFFSNVSHEFRTPLTLMLGPLEDALAASGGEGDKQRERLEMAHRNALRLLKLVNTLLDFSRIEAGRFQACYEPTDLAAFTADLASVFRSLLERAGLRLIIRCPQISERVYVDREMWEKIVFNLISNAFKFTFAGEIEVSIKEVKGAVELAVRDTGTGIPAEDLPHVFERFYRVKSAHGRTFEGSGIGLALIQELARLHGGGVRVESEIARGSTFLVTVPLGKNHLPSERIGAERTSASTGLRGEAYVQEALRWLPDAANAPEEIAISSFLSGSRVAPDGERAGQNRARILLADDNADMREYVRRLLEEQYEVMAVGDGQSALERARNEHPDLVLADVMMPRLDGFGLLREVRADANLKTTPVILVSARAGEESRIEGLDAGADDYLVKPFSARELLARVGAHLAMAKVRREAAELERKLRAETEHRAAIVDSSDDAIISKNLDGIITSWNKGAERVFGYTAQEAIGQRTTLIVPPSRLDEEVEILARLRRGERIEHFETIRKRKDGTLVDVFVTISPVKDAQDRIIGASKVARDITQRKRMERVLREVELSGRLLQLQDEERRRVARELHDGAGQLLAALSMNLHAVANEKPALSPHGARCLRESFTVIEQAVSEIRTMSHLLHPPLLDEVGLRSALREYVEGFGERSSIGVRLDLPSDLGRLPRDVELSLFRIVQECLTNIHRHSGSATACVRLSRVPGEVQLEVSDKGRGIDPEIQEKFFAGKSSGVGLRGMRERVRQLGGAMQIQSGHNGTSIVVVLPLSGETNKREERFVHGSAAMAQKASTASGRGNP